MNKRNSSETRIKALELWQSPEGAGEPLVCIATSFTFDATFFETECLGRFLQMDSHPQENEAISYLIEREEKLASARVCVLVDRRHAQSKESMRWDVLSTVVPSAVQHAKIALLCWANYIRVIIGSGNLTESGYRKNLEVFGMLNASRDGGGSVDEILSSIAFLEQVVNRALGDEARPGPKQRAYEALALLRKHVRDWPRSSVRTLRVMPVFGGVGESILEQLRGLLPGGPPRYVEALSPFFDGEGRSAELIQALSRVLAKRRPRAFELSAPFEDLPDGSTRIFAPWSLIAATKDSCDVLVHKVLHEQDDEIRPLHAKMLTLANDYWKLWLIGSSNFTRAGLGFGKPASNLEANLAYIARADASEADLLNRIWPAVHDEPVDLDSESILWDPAFEEGEGNVLVPLPAAFREALFDPGSGPPQLILSLGENLPSSWSIRVPGGEELINSQTWNRQAGECALKWEQRSVPFVLGVEWETNKGRYSADWPVNVVEPALLPPPEMLRDLTLEDLVEILGSTRPMHIAIINIFKKRVRPQSSDIQLDPHKRVNTETFLLRRTRRVALALERMRERLERPAFSVDALDWRLRGPVGPLALATAFRRDARTATEARFFLAELGLTLSRVRIGYIAQGGLSQKVIGERIRLFIDEVEGVTMSLDDTNSPAMQSYVTAAFEAAKK